MCVWQGAELSLRRLSEEKAALQFRLKHLEDDNQQLHRLTQHKKLELTHTVEMLNRYTDRHMQIQTQWIKEDNGHEQNYKKR